tara:strand:- start:49 stop:243 length:195 start_codon:yes stop_codon:yes gene_type:complete
MLKKNKNIFLFILSVLFSIISGLIVYYWKQEEIDLLKQTNLELELQNKKLKKKIDEYSLVISKL